jgi:integrase
MNITYNLQDNKIFLYVTDKGRVRIYTGETVEKKNYWNTSSKRCKKIEPFGEAKNILLDKLEEHVHTIIREAKGQGIGLDLKKEVKEFLQKYKEVTAPVKPIEEFKLDVFNKTFDHFIEVKSRSITLTKRKISDYSITNFKNIKEQLTFFASETGFDLSLQTMNNSFYLTFQDFVINTQGKSINTFGKYIRGLKTFLNWCLDNDIPVNPKFRKMEVLQEYKGVDSLTQDQLIKIYELDFTSPELYENIKNDFDVNRLQLVQKIKTLERMRDVFLFACYTGLRISDIQTLTHRDIKDDVIVKRMQKTNIECVVPFYDDNIFKPVEIVNKYKGKYNTLLPPCYKINENLHIIQKLLKIPFELTSKIGRKTFVTLKILQGVATRVIMLSTGHQTEKAFNRYVGINSDQLVKAYKEKGSFLKVS